LRDQRQRARGHLRHHRLRRAGRGRGRQDLPLRQGAARPADPRRRGEGGTGGAHDDAAVEEVMLLFDAVAVLVLVALALVVQRLVAGAPAPGNPAKALLAAGHLVGAFLVAASVVAGSPVGASVGDDALWTAAFGLVAVALHALAARLGTAVIIGAGLRKEIERGNPAAGVAAAGHHVATGVVVASCVYGHDLGSLGVALLFFVVAQVTLHLFV